MKKKRTLEDRGMDWSIKYGTPNPIPLDFSDAWVAGYKAGRRAAKKPKKKARSGGKVKP